MKVTNAQYVAIAQDCCLDLLPIHECAVAAPQVRIVPVGVASLEKSVLTRDVADIQNDAAGLCAANGVGRLIEGDRQRRPAGQADIQHGVPTGGRGADCVGREISAARLAYGGIGAR